MTKARQAAHFGIAVALLASSWAVQDQHRRHGASSAGEAGATQQTDLQAPVDEAIVQPLADDGPPDPFANPRLEPPVPDPPRDGPLSMPPPQQQQRADFPQAQATAQQQQQQAGDSPTKPAAAMAAWTIGELIVESSEVSGSGYVEYLVRATLRGDSARATGSSAEVVAAARAVSPEVIIIADSLHFTVKAADDLDVLSRDAIRVRIKGGQTFDATLLRWSISAAASADGNPVAASRTSEAEAEAAAAAAQELPPIERQ